RQSHRIAATAALIGLTTPHANRYSLAHPMTPSRIDSTSTSSAASEADARPRHLHRELKLPSLIALTFFCVAGGAYGLEDAVGAAGPAIVLLGLLILPWLWSLPN